MNPPSPWMPSLQTPYPVPMAKYPVKNSNVNVYYNGKLCTQHLSPYKGPIMYPTNSSIPGPFLQSYINLPTKSYMY